jgi:hypothetical protein
MLAIPGEEYGKTILTLAALFVAFHAPAWIRTWYLSRRERNIHTLRIPVPKVRYPADCAVEIRLADIILS